MTAAKITVVLILEQIAKIALQFVPLSHRPPHQHLPLLHPQTLCDHFQKKVLANLVVIAVILEH